MTAPVDVRPARHPRGPSLVATDIDSGTHALRTRLRIVEAEGNRVSVGDLDDHAMRAMREEPIEAVAAATALWDLLSDVLYTPQIAAGLPRAPYEGVGSAQPWHVLGYRLLPAAVILAGEDTIEAALAGTLDPGAVPDPGVEAAFTVYESARNAAADYCHRTIQGARGKDAYLSILAAWDEFTHPDWEGVTSEGLWRTDLLWKPFTEAEMSDKELARFIHTKSPLTYTRRYPSTPQNVEYPALRRQGRRADKARTARIMWVSFATSAINNTFNMLTEELHGGDNPMIAGPLFAPDPKPWTDTPTLRNVNTALTSGFRFPRPEDGTLPGLDQVFPEGDARTGMVQVSVTRPSPEDLTVTVALPPKNLPSMEDTVVGVIRIVADTLLTEVPNLTDHARSVLTGWRNAGPGPFGGRTEFTDHIDAIVALASDKHGHDWPTS